jgi:hypothetical protein
MSVGKKIGIGIGSFFGLLILAGVIIFILILRPPAGPPAPPPLPPGSATSATSTPAPALQQQIDTIQEKIKESQQTGQAQEVKLTITEGEANAQLKKGLPVTASGMTISSGDIYFRPGQVIIQIGAAYSGFTVYPKIQVNLVIKDGKVFTEVVDLELGAVPLPVGKEQIAGLVNEQFQNALAAAKGITITKVEVGNQSVTVTGMTQVAK